MRTLLLLLALSSGSVSVTGQPRGSSYNIKPGVKSAGACHVRRIHAISLGFSLPPTFWRPQPTAPPVLTSLSPTVGVREGGVTLTLTGAGFARTSGLAVRFANAAGSVVVPATYVDPSTVGAHTHSLAQHSAAQCRSAGVAHCPTAVGSLCCALV